MYNKNNARIKTTSCGAVVWRLTDAGLDFLLIKQFAHKDSWGIPKGHVQGGESLEECAIREVREEAGVLVRLGDRLSDIATHFRNEDKTVVSYLASPVGNHTPDHNDPDSEVADARWFNVLSLPRIHVYQRSLLEEAVSLLLKSRLNLAFNETEIIAEHSDDAETQSFREKIRELLRKNVTTNDKR